MENSPSAMTQTPDGYDYMKENLDVKEVYKIEKKIFLEMKENEKLTKYRMLRTMYKKCSSVDKILMYLYNKVLSERDDLQEQLIKLNFQRLNKQSYVNIAVIRGSLNNLFFLLLYKKNIGIIF